MFSLLGMRFEFTMHASEKCLKINYEPVPKELQMMSPSRTVLGSFTLLEIITSGSEIGVNPFTITIKSRPSIFEGIINS